MSQTGGGQWSASVFDGEGPTGRDLPFRHKGLDFIVKQLYLLRMTNPTETKQLIYNRLRRIVDKHTRMDDHPFRLDDSVKLSPREVRAIDFLGQGGPINVTGVARHFGFTKSAASQLINRLAKRGMVSKELSEHSDKEYQLTLTPQGRKAHEAIEVMDRERLETFLDVISRFSGREIAATAAVLEQIEAMVDERLKRFG